MSKPVSGKKCKKIAEKDDRFRVEWGKGDHFKIYGPDRSMMTCPYKDELAIGTGQAVRKWFLRFGVVITLAAGIVAFLI